MTEHSVNDLSYGHFGELIYDTEQHKWLSSRHTTKGDGLKALGAVKTYITSETAGDSGDQLKRKRYGNGYLYRKLPVMGLVAPEELTQLVAETEQPGFDHKDDWKILERVVHARLRVWDQQGRRHNVLVFPGGASGSILKTIVLREARQGWGIDRSNSAWLKTFDLKEVNSTSWQADGNIRQICFATNFVDDPHPLLAFRTARSITVVSPRIPVLQDTTSRAMIAEDHATTRIHLEQVLKLGVEAMNGAEFVDLSFNPWFPTTLAAVTEHGRWYLRTLLPRLHTVEYSENLDGYFGDFDEDDTPDEGWHRILWTSNSTFIICDRKILKAYRRQGQIVTCINADVLVSHQSTVIITDLKRSPVEDSCIFITTATHIMYLRVNRDLRNSEADPTFSILLSWRHNRSAVDKTLRLSFIEEEEGLKIVLFSRATGLATVYDLASTDHEHPLKLTSFDPATSNIINTRSATSHESPCSDIIILPSALRGRLTQPDADLDEDSWLKKCMVNKYGFYQSFLLHHDFTLNGQLGYAQLTDIDRTDVSPPVFFIPAPLWTVVRRRHKRRNALGMGLAEDDDFLDDEADENTNGSEPQSLMYKLRRQGHRSLVDDELWEQHDLTIPFDAVYEEITKSVESTEVSVDELVQAIKLDSSDAHLEILSSYLPHSIAPQILAMERDLFAELQTAMIPSASTMSDITNIEVLGPAKVLNTGLDGSSSTATREALRAVFTSSLSRLFSGAVRHYHDELIENIVFTTTFARNGVHFPGDEVSVSPIVRSSGDLESQGTSQMVATASSQRSAQGGADDEDQSPEEVAAEAQRVESISDTIQRLQSLTIVDTPPTTQSNISALTLNHWQIATDPASYDYDAKAAEQEGTINLEGSAMTGDAAQQQKRKKQKDHERLGKRQKVADRLAASQQSQQQSQMSQASFPVMSSQPAAFSGIPSSQAFMPSSQVFESQMTTSSQPVGGRGRLGGFGRAGGRRGRRAGF